MLWAKAMLDATLTVKGEIWGVVSFGSIGFRGKGDAYARCVCWGRD
jgi:hypothetical protein